MSDQLETGHAGFNASGRRKVCSVYFISLIDSIVSYWKYQLKIKVNSSHVLYQKPADI